MTTIDKEIIRYFSSLIEKETGIVYDTVNEHLLGGRLLDLCKILNFKDIDALWQDIKKRGITAVEREVALDLATNNETSFFRDPEVFDFFRHHFVPKETSEGGRIRIWSAACSTGQEPYSLAMIFSQLAAQGIRRSYDILATDFSERVLKKAKSGIYTQLEVQRGLPAPLLVQYFEQIKTENSQLSSFQLKGDLSRSIAFQRLNLLDSWPPMDLFHIIFCRNVLIYQSVENKKRVIQKLTNLLHPGGYLVLGGAESLLGLSSDYEMQVHGKACVYRIKPALRATA